MSNVSTFGGFSTARLGIYASQKALEVVGNNISNINTPNYTRQVLQQKALHVGGVDHYTITNDIRVGAGALCTGVTQLRDPYLDIRYRNEYSNVGAMDAKLAGLEQLSAIFDEVGKGTEKDGVLELAFKEFFDKLQANNTEGASRDTYNNIVRNSAESLVRWFRDYGTQLETLKKNHETAFRQDIKRVNTVLTGIRDLSEQIRKENIHGGDALELKDERNALIDELSGYMRIHVTYSEEDIGAGMTVEKLKIEMADKTSVFGGITLIDGIYGAQLSIQQQPIQKTDANGEKLFRAIGGDGTEYTKAEIDAWIATGGNNASWEDYEPVPSGETEDDPLFRLQASVLRDRHDNIKPGEERRFDKAVADPTLDVEKYKDKDGEMYLKIGDNFMYGSLQSTREILTEAGEYSTIDDVAIDPDCTTKRGIPFYEKALDHLANVFAKWFNDANTMDMSPTTNPNVYWNTVTDSQTDNTLGAGVEHFQFYDGDPEKGGNPITNGEYWALTTTDADGKTTTKYYLSNPTNLNGKPLTDIEMGPAEIAALQEKCVVKDPDTIADMRAGVLFSNGGDGDDTEGITAKNLSISKSWSTDQVQILRTKDPEAFKNQSTASDNLNHFVAIMDKTFDFMPNDIITDPPAADGDKAYFRGSFFGMLTKVNSTLGTDKKSTEEALENYSIAQEDLYLAREGVSGVDLNDETVNMMQFQKSYTAACRLLTTIDEMLERLIANTGIVGR